MKSFKSFLANPQPSYEWLSFMVEEYHVHMLFESAAGSILTEAKHRGFPLGGQYSAQLHSAHSAVGQQHLHVGKKRGQAEFPAGTDSCESEVKIEKKESGMFS